MWVGGHAVAVRLDRALLLGDRGTEQYITVPHPQTVLLYHCPLFPVPQDFFTGAAVVLSAVGGHAIAVEMMDAMESPKHVRKGPCGPVGMCVVTYAWKLVWDMCEGTCAWEHVCGNVCECGNACGKARVETCATQR